LVPQQAPVGSGASFAGASAPELFQGAQVSITARHSPGKPNKSCFKLFFKRRYGHKHINNLTEKSYKLWMVNRFKKRMRWCMRKIRAFQAGEEVWSSREEAVEKMTPLLDEAFHYVDVTGIQGLIQEDIIARSKDRVLIALRDALVQKGIIEKPADQFEPAFKTLGYEIPQCYAKREPRPWELPGYKSPWDIFDEYHEWKANSIEKKKIRRKERFEKRKAFFEKNGDYMEKMKERREKWEQQKEEKTQASAVWWAQFQKELASMSEEEKEKALSDLREQTVNKRRRYYQSRVEYYERLREHKKETKGKELDWRDSRNYEAAKAKLERWGGPPEAKEVETAEA
jgi:hypothetical protein